MDGHQVLAKPRQIQSRYGAIMVPSQDDLIGTFLHRYGEWGWDETRFVASVLRDGARVLDGGAFLGTFSLGLSAQKRLGFLCAVEANSGIVDLLSENIRANAACPAVVVDAMLAGSAADPRPGFHHESNLGSTSFTAADSAECMTGPAAKVVTLAELRRDHGPFDLVKLDVEGMEAEILQGDREHIATGATALWIECNEQPQSLRLAEMLLSWGLEVHYFAFPSHNPDNFRGETEPVLPWAFEAGLLVAAAWPPSLEPALDAHGCILARISDIGDLREAMWRTPRWLPREFAHATRVDLAAAAGRALRGESRATFLREPQPPGELEQARARLAEAEAALEQARTLAAEMVEDCRLEAERRAVVERQLANANAAALARLAELGHEREQRQAAEARADAAQARLAGVADDAAARVAAMSLCCDEVRAQLDAHRRTLVWRAAMPVHAFLGRRPTMHAALRRLRALVGTTLGRRG